MDKLLITLIALFLIAGGGYFVWQNINSEKPDNVTTPTGAEITNFEECVAAGNPVMESYPRQCKTADGKHFVENIGNANEVADLIQVDLPRPNEKIASPLTVTGQARGNWFFEAQFSVKLIDADNNEIGNGLATAQGEWMTADFVPFTTATIEFDAPGTPTGSLIMQKNNPSGLPEHDNQLVIPVKF